MGFFAFSVAVVGFVMLRMRMGTMQAIFEGLTLFAAPILVAFEVGIYYFMPIRFPLRVSQFGSSITNAEVLNVALYLTIVGCSFFFPAPIIARKELAREERILRRAGFEP